MAGVNVKISLHVPQPLQRQAQGPGAAAGEIGTAGAELEEAVTHSPVVKDLKGGKKGASQERLFLCICSPTSLPS